MLCSPAWDISRTPENSGKRAERRAPRPRNLQESPPSPHYSEVTHRQYKCFVHLAAFYLTSFLSAQRILAIIHPSSEFRARSQAFLHPFGAQYLGRYSIPDPGPFSPYQIKWGISTDPGHLPISTAEMGTRTSTVGGALCLLVQHPTPSDLVWSSR